MRMLNNDKGIALVTALMLTLISLTVIMAILYMISLGITTSAAHKRYHNSLEAAHGGVEFFTKEILPKLILDYANGTTTPTITLTQSFSNVSLATSADGCIKQKLLNKTAEWTACGASAKDPANLKIGYDSVFTLLGVGNQGNFKIFSKIVDTTPGNSDPSGIDFLDGGLGVAGTNSGITPKHLPTMFRIEVQGEREVNPTERALLSVLYAY